MWDLIVSVPDHCLSFYFDSLVISALPPCIYNPKIQSTIIPLVI